jgi:hypothetical protein
MVRRQQLQLALDFCFALKSEFDFLIDRVPSPGGVFGYPAFFGIAIRGGEDGRQADKKQREKKRSAAQLVHEDIR